MNNNKQTITEAYYYILLSLQTPRHAYGVKKQIEALTNNRVKLSAGTLYGAIEALLRKGFIIPYRLDSSSKKDYIITEQGKIVLFEEYKRLSSLIDDYNKCCKISKSDMV